jgi:hypothetical protein
MKVHHAGVRLPLLDGLVHAGVVEGRRTAEPPGETFLCTDIVTWKDIQPPETSEQDVLGRPSANASQFA